MNVKIYNASNNPLPKYETEGSAGLDLRANIEEPITIKPTERISIPTGISMELPIGYEAQIRPRSGLARKFGINVFLGTIDSDYRGEIGVTLINQGHEDFVIEPADRIAQMVIAPIIQVNLMEVSTAEELTITERSSGGYGSTGIK